MQPTQTSSALAKVRFRPTIFHRSNQWHRVRRYRTPWHFGYNSTITSNSVRNLLRKLFGIIESEQAMLNTFWWQWISSKQLWLQCSKALFATNHFKCVRIVCLTYFKLCCAAWSKYPSPVRVKLISRNNSTHTHEYIHNGWLLDLLQYLQCFSPENNCPCTCVGQEDKGPFFCLIPKI